MNERETVTRGFKQAGGLNWRAAQEAAKPELLSPGKDERTCHMPNRKALRIGGNPTTNTHRWGDKASADRSMTFGPYAHSGGRRPLSTISRPGPNQREGMRSNLTDSRQFTSGPVESISVLLHGRLRSHPRVFLMNLDGFRPRFCNSAFPSPGSSPTRMSSAWINFQNLNTLRNVG